MSLITHNDGLIISKISKESPLHDRACQHRYFWHGDLLLLIIMILKPNIMLSQDLLHERPLILTPKFRGHKRTNTRLTGYRLIEPIT